MSYTPLRDKETYSIKYEGINLSTGGKIFPTTPMLFDIMALQEIYGATTETKSGNDTYTFTPNSLPFECIYDTSGEDTLDLNLIKGGTNLDLSGNKISTIGDDYLYLGKMFLVDQRYMVKLKAHHLELYQVQKLKKLFSLQVKYNHLRLNSSFWLEMQILYLLMLQEVK